MALVVDASVAVAWFVVSQATAYADRVLERAASEPLHVPALLYVEFAGALVKLAHRRKIKPEAIDEIIDQFEALNLVTDKNPPSARTISAVCREYSLSAYDAVYFELARRQGLDLAVSDAVLTRIAKRAGITVA